MFTQNRQQHNLDRAPFQQDRELHDCRPRADSLNPKHQILDNEASAKYKSAIIASGMTYQPVLSDDHCRNIAKKAFQFWKNHFVAVLSGASSTFPLCLWCQDIHQIFKLSRRRIISGRLRVFPALALFSKL